MTKVKHQKSVLGSLAQVRSNARIWSAGRKLRCSNVRIFSAVRKLRCSNARIWSAGRKLRCFNACIWSRKGLVSNILQGVMMVRSWLGYVKVMVK